MPTQYIPIFIFAALAAAFPALSLVLFKLIRPTPVAVGAKLKPYECGVEAEGDTRGRYSVRFYIVAILFVIFDVETTFLFPCRAVFHPAGRVPSGTGVCAGKHVCVPGYSDHWVRLALSEGRSGMGVREAG